MMRAASAAGTAVPGQTTSSGLSFAISTVAVLRSLVLESEWESAKDLMNLIKKEGKQMIKESGNRDIVVGNLVRRILKIIREDYFSSVDKPCPEETTTSTIAETETPTAATTTGSGDADQAAMLAGGGVAGTEVQDFTSSAPDLKAKIAESIDELAMELETSADEISAQGLEHIHASEVILTVGRSRTVEMFLKRAAAKGRNFQVILAESAPFYSGHELAESLAKAKIQTTVITDSAIFAMMSRVNKVIVGTQAIMADGGLKANSGVYTVALAAHHYSVPFIVTASMHKLTPQYFTSMNAEEFGCFVSPQDIMRGVANGKLAHKVHASFPLFEYVPPDLVTLFISNMSGHAPSYVYRLLSELYHPDDYQL